MKARPSLVVNLIEFFMKHFMGILTVNQLTYHSSSRCSVGLFGDRFIQILVSVPQILHIAMAIIIHE